MTPDEECDLWEDGGEPDKEVNPEAFYWDCCLRPGNAKGCTVARHALWNELWSLMPQLFDSAAATAGANPASAKAGTSSKKRKRHDRCDNCGVEYLAEDNSIDSCGSYPGISGVISCWFLC
jgi:hypothetical protein